MGHTLFAASLMPPRAHTVAAAAVPFSLAVHAAVVGGLLAVPLLGGSSPAPVVGRAPVLEMIAIALPQTAVATTPPALPRPGPRPRTRQPESAVVSAPAVTQVPLGPDLPALSDIANDTTGCSGCALTTGPGSPGGGEPGFPTGGTGIGDGAASAPLIVGRQITAPAKLRHVDPVYPDLAQRARVQGVVEIECIIDRDGRVASTRVVRGVALLDAAALAAVEQWRYRPTLLNGVPVPVLMTVTVYFRLR